MPKDSAAPILVVDLDDSLVRTDMLVESLCSALATRWERIFGAGFALLRGRAALKAALAEENTVNIRRLPYDAAVLDRVKTARAAGIKTALVTATNQNLAEAIADHLGLFDEVHGSSATLNLKGARKAAFLVERYGRGGFDYIGDSAADLAVWAEARGRITVNIGAGLKSKVDAMGGEITHLGDKKPLLGPVLRALRPHQWAKNALVFVPLLTAQAFDGASVLAALMAFAAFSAVASSVYLLNDLVDLGADRAHPRKCRRPFASGDLALKHGLWLAPGLLVGGLVLAALVNMGFLLVLMGYYLVTLAYSLSLKRLPILDICALAALYTIRILAGAAAIAVVPSVWLLAFSMFFFFSQAAIKRQAELVNTEDDGKGVRGRGYAHGDEPVVAQMALGSGYVSVLVMALYINTPYVQQLYSQPAWLWAICGVLLYWISRLSLITHRGEMHDDPVIFAVRDRVSLISLGLILMAGILAAVG